MTRHNPFSTTQITVSFRTHRYTGPCAFISVTRDEDGGLLALVDSSHHIGQPEQLVDTVLELVRAHSISHWLVDQDPF